MNPKSSNTPCMSRIKALMATVTEPVDDRFIAERAFVGRRTFSCNYRPMLIAEGVMHVAEYRRVRNGPFVAFFMPGRAPDGYVPPRPEVTKPKDIARRWKERTAYYEKIKAERRLKRPPDPALAALLGLTPRYQKHKAAEAA